MLCLEPARGALRSGAYFSAGREQPVAASARDPELARRCYEASAAAVGVSPSPEP